MKLSVKHNKTFVCIFFLCLPLWYPCNMRYCLPSLLIIYSEDNYTGLCVELLVLHLERLMHSHKVHRAFHGSVHRKVLTDQISLFID